MGKHLSQEERDEIVRLHLEEGRSTRGLASEFGISRGAILNWIRL
jgi:transposase-like protein